MQTFAMAAGQVVEAGGHVRVLGSEDLLPDCQRALKERFGLGVSCRPGDAAG
jgi:hypothetical protein